MLDTMSSTKKSIHDKLHFFLALQSQEEPHYTSFKFRQDLALLLFSLESKSCLAILTHQMITVL